MKRNKKAIPALVLTLAMTAGSIPVMAEAESVYPTDWDLSLLYEDEEAWQSDYEKVYSMLDTYEEMRGTLNTAQGLYDFMEFAYGGELTEIEGRLSLYADMGNNLDGTDPVYSNMLLQISELYSEESQAMAYFDEEFLSLSLEEREAIINDPLLEEWYYILEDYADPDAEAFSEETNAVLAVKNFDAGRSALVSAYLLNVDMPDPEITLPDGTVIAMNDAEYYKIVSDNSYDSELKEEAIRLRMTKVLPYLYTLTALLEGTVLENYLNAAINGYETSREAALDGNIVETEIYDLLIDAVHSGTEDYQRYLTLHGEALGLEVQESYDLSTRISSYSQDDTAYDDAVDEVREALSILGEDYIAYYDELMTGGYIDVYPADYKTTGAFSSGNTTGSRPYQLFNYGGSFDDVSTIAHEMGHAIYSCYSQDNQPIEYSAPGIFTQEVASTTNEIIYINYKMDHAADDEERLYYLEELIRLINGTLFSQTLYAEFEDQMYSIVENGESLNPEDLTARWAELQTLYEGDSVKELPETAYFWAQIPHFHYNFYVYQYATAISYAASIYTQIAGEDSQTAIDNYKAFLSAGASARPSDLLSIAGIDPLQEETYQQALAYYSSLVDEYEALIAAR